jgi:AhpD family alkylhydroperoxidase
MATSTELGTSINTATFLPPVEKPKGLFLKMGYFFMKKKFGKVMTPLSVFSARMPTAFTLFYGKIGALDKKLKLSSDTALLLRQRVASINGCLYCIDTSRAAALDKSMDNEAKYDALGQYRTSPLFTDAERSALDYATELTANHAVARDTFAQLSRYYNERQICDIVWVVASEHLYNINNIGVNIGSDGFCAISAKKKSFK